MRFHKWHDSYTLRARKEGFPARSVYKLAEIQERFKIIGKGARVVDLGCFPGSWLLFASKAVGSSGKVIGVDLKPVSISLPANVRSVCGDILKWDQRAMEEHLEGRFDVVLSDMAPSCTGTKFVDVQRSLELCRRALWVSEQVLRVGGALVCKVFQGTDLREFDNEVKGVFSRISHIRPKSTRKGSKEIYVVGLEKKRPNEQRISS